MAGERQPGKFNVFISYSRADEAFADELKLGLEDRGYTVEIDKHSIRAGEEWKARLGKVIKASDTVVFVLSPDSARSPVCHWEVDEAHAQAKRIVPVLHRGLHERPRGKQPDGSPWPEGLARAPERLSLINYPRFDEGRSFMAALRGLVQALEDDLDWIEAHCRLATRARDWDDGGRPTNRLVTGGGDIAAAKRLVETRKGTAPPMLPVQLDFIQASEAHEAAQRRIRLLTITGLSILLLCIGGPALWIARDYWLPAADIAFHSSLNAARRSLGSDAIRDCWLCPTIRVADKSSTNAEQWAPGSFLISEEVVTMGYRWMFECEVRKNCFPFPDFQDFERPLDKSNAALLAHLLSEYTKRTYIIIEESPSGGSKLRGFKVARRL